MKRTSIPTKMSFAGLNGLLWRMSKNESIEKRLIATYQASRLTKNSREDVNELYYRG